MYTLIVGKSDLQYINVYGMLLMLTYKLFWLKMIYKFKKPCLFLVLFYRHVSFCLLRLYQSQFKFVLGSNYDGHSIADVKGIRH